MAKNYYLGSYHQASEAFEFLFNKDFMEDLDDDLRAIMEYSVEAASTANTALALNEYSKDLQELQDVDGVTVRQTPPEILEAQLEAWKQLIVGLEEDTFFKKILDSQREWVERVSYYELLNSPDYRLAYNFFFPGKLPS